MQWAEEISERKDLNRMAFSALNVISSSGMIGCVCVHTHAQMSAPIVISSPSHQPLKIFVEPNGANQIIFFLVFRFNAAHQ